MKQVVLLKSRSQNHGGLEKYASRIAKAFTERGSRVTILTTGDHLQVEIPVFSRRSNPAFAACWSTKTVPWPAFLRMEQFDAFVQKWLKNNKADLVFGMDRNRWQTHIRAGNGVHAAYLESRIFTEGKIKAYLCKLNPLHRKILELEKCGFENPDLEKLFTNSYMVRQQLLNYYQIDPKKIEVIHNGVEWDEMQTDFSDWSRERSSALKKFTLKPDVFHFLFIGHGYLRKGLDRLLVGLSKLTRRDFHLSVIGKDNSIDFYRAKTAQLKLTENVHFFGPSQEIRRFYQLADCLVIPSFYDPFANVTVEALAMGLFVVSSKNNGGHEILNSQNGAVIDDLLSDDAMVAALETALNNRKTETSSQLIRESVKHLDFSNQLRTLMDSCG